MNIEELADQADIASPWRPMSKLQLLQLKKFAELVAAHEREECAKVCETLAYTNPQKHHFAHAIRARGQA